MFGDFDFLFGEDEPDPDGRVYVSFQDERVSEEQTETDVKNMEGRLKMSLQQLKEQVLGKVRTDSVVLYCIAVFCGSCKFCGLIPKLIHLFFGSFFFFILRL